jgi:hypothetical protein
MIPASQTDGPFGTFASAPLKSLQGEEAKTESFELVNKGSIIRLDGMMHVRQSALNGHQ